MFNVYMYIFNKLPFLCVYLYVIQVASAVPDATGHTSLLIGTAG